MASEPEAFARYTEHTRSCAACAGDKRCDKGVGLFQWWKKIEAAENRSRRSSYEFERLAASLLPPPEKVVELWPGIE